MLFKIVFESVQCKSTDESGLLNKSVTRSPAAELRGFKFFSLHYSSRGLGSIFGRGKKISDYPILATSAALTEKVPLHSEYRSARESVRSIAYNRRLRDRHFKNWKTEVLTTNIIIIIEPGWR